MRIRGTSLLALVALAASGCSDQQQGLFQSGTNRVTLASSHDAYLLQAEVTMMFLSYVAVETGNRTSAQAIAAVSALNEAALAIDCIRGEAASWDKDKDWNVNCGDPGKKEFFYTKLLTVARSLLALGRASLPDASLNSLLSALPQASANPLALVTPLVGVAMDAAIVLPRGGAAYLDYRDIIVVSFCRGSPPEALDDCVKDAPDRLRGNLVLGRGIQIDSQPFTAARRLSKVNCSRLGEIARASTSAVTINCKMGLPTS